MNLGTQQCNVQCHIQGPRWQSDYVLSRPPMILGPPRPYRLLDNNRPCGQDKWAGGFGIVLPRCRQVGEVLVGRNIRLHALPWLVCRNADGNLRSPSLGAQPAPSAGGDVVISNLIFVPLFWGIRAVRHHGVCSRVSRVYVSIDRNLILFPVPERGRRRPEPRGGVLYKKQRLLPGSSHD